MEVDPQRLFKFRFKSPSMDDNIAYFVLTDDIEKMKLFLKQHNFDLSTAVVECVLLKDHEGDDEYMLEPFILKSNYSPKEYKIMSTEHMIYECGNRVAAKMSSSLIFGQTIVRDDVPLMKLISELIYKLDHVYVLDHTLCDPKTKKPYSDAYEQYTKCGYYKYMPDAYKLENEPPTYDDAAIYESIEYSITRDHPLPFTLEMYVSYFAELLTDSYC